MKNHSLKPYLRVIQQKLSERAAARSLNLPKSTLRDRLIKIKTRGSLTHGNTGHKNRKPLPGRDKIIALARKYEDFGISHICELLESRDGIVVNRETLRRWLARPRVRKISKQRQRREPRSMFGELLHIDGSFHNWFGDRKSCLMHIVDDATNTAELHFEAEETIESACRCAWEWFKKYGVPKAFYADGRNMYHLNPDTEHNFFTNMCENLGIRVIMAHSPQAKGRVERWNGVHQRRLVPLLALDGARDMDSANKYLEEHIIAHNRKFSKLAPVGNSHVPLPMEVKEIEEVCYIEIERQLKNDWTFSYKRKIYKFPPQNICPPAKSKIQLRITISGKITAFYRRSEIIVQEQLLDKMLAPRFNLE